MPATVHVVVCSPFSLPGGHVMHRVTVVTIQRSALVVVSSRVASQDVKIVLLPLYNAIVCMNNVMIG